MTDSISNIRKASTPLLAATGSGEIVRTLAGNVEGLTEGAVTAFLGVPYAAPPIGRNRWRAPQPVPRWMGVRTADCHGDDCAQVVLPGDDAPLRANLSEDCLFLNIWKPSSATAGSGVGDALPVMVWIHGGGFVSGGSSPAIYDGAAFARDGVVFVSINYRLGRFGFFAHPGLADVGYGGNFGFLDQIAALEWVRDNIASFGGDPANVTVFGESAGGMAVHYLLQSTLARGLFARAIIQSGGGRNIIPPPTMAKAARAGSVFAPGMDAAALRALPEEVVTGDLSVLTITQAAYSGPMIDGRTILGQSIDAIAAGLYPDVPVLVGANSADGFARSSDKNVLFAGFGADADRARDLYDPSGDRDVFEAAVQVYADAAFIEPARAVARGIAAVGGTAFLYRFAHVGVTIGPSMGGAPHASEIPYIFDTADQRQSPIPSESDAEVARIMHGCWLAFARTGRPDGEGGAPWPAATPGDTTVHLIESDRMGQAEDPLTARLDFAELRATRVGG